MTIHRLVELQITRSVNLSLNAVQSEPRKCRVMEWLLEDHGAYITEQPYLILVRWVTCLANVQVKKVGILVLRKRLAQSSPYVTGKLSL